MPNSSMPILNIYQSYLEVSAQLAAVTFAMADKMTHASLLATHQALNEQLKLAYSLAQSRQASEARENFQPAFLPASSAKLIRAPSDVMLLATEMQKEFGSYFQRYIEQVKSGITA
ncbi:MAG: hypothetical protein V4632_10815 [Pseudomonadota bacterium]